MFPPLYMQRDGAGGRRDSHATLTELLASADRLNSKTRSLANLVSDAEERAASAINARLVAEERAWQIASQREAAEAQASAALIKAKEAQLRMLEETEIMIAMEHRVRELEASHQCECAARRQAEDRAWEFAADCETERTLRRKAEERAAIRESELKAALAFEAEMKRLACHWEQRGKLDAVARVGAEEQASDKDISAMHARQFAIETSTKAVAVEHEMSIAKIILSDVEALSQHWQSRSTSEKLGRAAAEEKIKTTQLNVTKSLEVLNETEDYIRHLEGTIQVNANTFIQAENTAKNKEIESMHVWARERETRRLSIGLEMRCAEEGRLRGIH
jgi:hypothetical protein